MDLEQLIPERCVWKKKIKGENGEREIEFAFRPFNLEDESWLKRTFGDKLQAVLESMDMDAISRMAFRQLELDGKRELMKLKFIDIDEDGNEIELATTGPAKLCYVIEGYAEQIELLKILLRTRGFSMPVLEKIANDFGEGDLGNAIKALKQK